MKRTTAKTVLALILVVVLTLALGAPALAARTMVSKQNLTVNGQAVYCFAQDFASAGGAMTAAQADKLLKVLRKARMAGAPVSCAMAAL